MDPSQLYQALLRSDRSGKTAAAFLRDLEAQGIDTSDITRASPANQGIPTARPDSQLARVLTTQDRVGRQNAGARNPPIRHMLSGADRREFERIMGKLAPDDIGPRRLPNGNIQIVAGCPGEYRRQLAARGGR